MWAWVVCTMGVLESWLGVNKRYGVFWSAIVFDLWLLVNAFNGWLWVWMTGRTKSTKLIGSCLFKALFRNVAIKSQVHLERSVTPSPVSTEETGYGTIYGFDEGMIDRMAKSFDALTRILCRSYITDGRRIDDATKACLRVHKRQ